MPWVLGHFVHRIEPLLLELGPVRFWYYGLAYCAGFVGIYLWFRFRRGRLGLNVRQVYDLTLLIAVCVLVCGRAFEIAVYEWDHYAGHPQYLLSFWHGGMASHGVLIGGVAGITLFSLIHRKSVLRIADEVVIPGALFLALGRIGNFVNGQIYGSVTDVWWGVQFPGTEELRHPVTLYEAAKNLALIPILLVVRRRWGTGRGVVMGHFVLWYGLLRILTDCFREYGTEAFGIGTGQYFNVLMALVGGGLVVGFSRRRKPVPRGDRREETAASGLGCEVGPAGNGERQGLWVRRVLLAVILFVALTIPSGWTVGVLDVLQAGQGG